MSKCISILGCGWLGLPLAEFLLAKGFQVKGATTSEEKLEVLKDAGISPFQIQVSPEGIKGEGVDDFFSSEILFVNFPPKRIPNIEEVYTKQMEQVLSRFTGKQVLFVSSTSVYPSLNREIQEEDLEPEKPSGKALKVAERLIENAQFSSTILRAAGLVGYDRMPGRFLAGKKELKNGDAPVNLVHRDDCLGVIWEIINQEKWGEVYNLCCDEHPTRKDFYVAEAKKAGLEEPRFKDEPLESYKIIGNSKLKRDLGYSFKYPDPKRF